MMTPTTALLEKLDKPVRPLKWRAYGNQHLSGWQGQGSMGGLWYITDTGPDGEGKDGWWCDGERFDTADEAKAAAQADYNRRILSALSLTHSELEVIKAALVVREIQADLEIAKEALPAPDDLRELREAAEPDDTAVTDEMVNDILAAIDKADDASFERSAIARSSIIAKAIRAALSAALRARAAVSEPKP